MIKNNEAFTMTDVAEYVRIRDAAAKKGNVRRAKLADSLIDLALEEIANAWMDAGKKTRTERLAKVIGEIAAKHHSEISALSYRGPRGGRNAKSIPG